MSESVNYQPTCDLKALKARAKMYAQLRQFFAERDVLEVETPVLSQAGVTDVHLASVQAQRHVQGKKQTHLPLVLTNGGKKYEEIGFSHISLSDSINDFTIVIKAIFNAILLSIG